MKPRPTVLGRTNPADTYILPGRLLQGCSRLSALTSTLMDFKIPCRRCQASMQDTIAPKHMPLAAGQHQRTLV